MSLTSSTSYMDGSSLRGFLAPLRPTVDWRRSPIFYCFGNLDHSFIERSGGQKTAAFSGPRHRDQFKSTSQGRSACRGSAWKVLYCQTHSRSLRDLLSWESPAQVFSNAVAAAVPSMIFGHRRCIMAELAHVSSSIE